MVLQSSRVRSTLFLLVLGVFCVGLLCSLVQTHQRVALEHRIARRLQLLPSLADLQQRLQQNTGTPLPSATSESVKQLVQGDRNQLINTARQLAEHAQADAQPTFLAYSDKATEKMMSSRGIVPAGVATRFKSMWSAYNRALLVRPLATKIATGVVGTIIGDGVAQYSSYRMSLPPTHSRNPKLRSHEFHYDFPRLFRLLAWSALVGTPIAHYWFNFLDTRIMPSSPTSLKAVAAKLLLDQGFMAPFGTSLFFMAMKVMEGQPERAVPEVRAKLWPVLLANWTVWPLANAINFAVIPPSQRILYVNVLAIAWSAFMSHMASKPAAGAPAPATVPGKHAGHHHGVGMRALEPATANKMT